MFMGGIYIIPKEATIRESMKLAEEYQACFEYNDFVFADILDDEAEVKRRVSFYKSLGRDRSKDTLHGAFLDVTVHSSDKKIREISELRVRQSLDIATELGIRGVVFHTNYIANFRIKTYMDNWVKMNAEFYSRMLEAYPSLEIYIENMFDYTPDLLARLAKKMEGENRFGVCLDYAHASISGCDIENWIKTLAPYVRHMHVNDNDLVDDLHQTVGEGDIDWQQYCTLLKLNHVHSSVLVEVQEIDGQKKSITYMKENKLYPYR